MPTVHVASAMIGVCLLVASTLFTLGEARATHIVEAPWGQIRGFNSISVSGFMYRSYLAIPYAVPPLGDLRFAKPVAHPGIWDGEVFDATTLGDLCLQLPSVFVSSAVGMSEDCLTLNVYVPVSPFTGPKSVMVWIHGEGFMNGGAPTYRPSELVTESDVIAVVIQYRVNTLGFLSSGDGIVPGNFGLWDQHLALLWVKTNIWAFGGDPESITFFGESAGAISVGFQMISPVSKGLTFRAILQSGTPLTPWAINRNPRQAFFNLANQTGCLEGVVSRRAGSKNFYFTSEAQKRAESKTVLDCLRRLDGEELIREIQFPEPTPFLSTLVWLPVVEGDFLPDHPARLISNVTYLDDVGVTKRDIMMGVTNEEGGIFVSLGEFFGGVRNSTEGRSEVIRRLLTDHLFFLFGEDLMRDPQRLDTLVNILEFFYTQGSNDGTRAISLQNIADVVGDTNFVLNTVTVIRDLAKAKARTSAFTSPSGRLYLYLFNHLPAFKAALPELKGTTHGDDLAYEFDSVPERDIRKKFTDVENAIGFIFRAMLASFAKSGKPEAPLLNINNQPSGFIPWPEFTLDKEEYLSLERVPQVDTDLFGSRVALWTDLIPPLLNSTLASEPTRPWKC